MTHAFARLTTGFLVFEVPRLLSRASAGSPIAGCEDRNAAENAKQVTPSIILHIHNVNNRSVGYVLVNHI
jgi:hypothetical protein